MGIHLNQGSTPGPDVSFLNPTPGAATTEVYRFAKPIHATHVLVTFPTADAAFRLSGKKGSAWRGMPKASKLRGGRPLVLERLDGVDEVIHTHDGAVQFFQLGDAPGQILPLQRGPSNVVTFGELSGGPGAVAIAALAGRDRVTLINVSGATQYLGSADTVNSTNGVPFEDGDWIELEWGEAVPVYIFTAGMVAGSGIRWVQEAP